MSIGMVSGLHRYPVKSMQGERLDELPFDTRGATADRYWAVVDERGKFGSGKSSRRFVRMEGLLEHRAHLDGGGRPVITFPDGSTADALAAATRTRLSAALGMRVTVEPEGEIPHHDEVPVHLVTSASLARLRELLPEAVLDARRFRPNVLVETEPGLAGFVEDAWIGRELTIGGLRLALTHRMPRCVMTTMAQRDLPHDASVLHTVTSANEACFGVCATVVAPGTVRVGDAVVVH